MIESPPPVVITPDMLVDSIRRLRGRGVAGHLTVVCTSALADQVRAVVMANQQLLPDLAVQVDDSAAPDELKLQGLKPVAIAPVKMPSGPYWRQFERRRRPR